MCSAIISSHSQIVRRFSKQLNHASLPLTVDGKRSWKITGDRALLTSEPKGYWLVFADIMDGGSSVKVGVNASG